MVFHETISQKCVLLYCFFGSFEVLGVVASSKLKETETAEDEGYCTLLRRLFSHFQ